MIRKKVEGGRLAPDLRVRRQRLLQPGRDLRPVRKGRAPARSRSTGARRPARTWTATRRARGWRLAELQCTGQSPVTIDRTTAKVSIALAGRRHGDVHVHRSARALRRLSCCSAKTTLGGVGAFTFHVKPDGSDNVRRDRCMGRRPRPRGPQRPATPSSIPLDAGRLRRHRDVTGPRRRTATGSYRPTSCNGISLDPMAPATVDILSAMGTECTFTNTFIPRGALSIGKITLRRDRHRRVRDRAGRCIPSTQLLQHATTTDEGVEAAATGDSSRRLDLGTYTIIETPSDHAGGWRVDARRGRVQRRAQGVRGRAV